MAYDTDLELERSTNRVMTLGAVLLLLLAALFPLYRLVEPAGRDEARAAHEQSMSETGASLWGFNCASCHGTAGEGGIGPALNSQQFLESSTDDQTRLLVSVGVPGSEMNAYSQDFGGPMTSEQIRAIAIFIRSWQDEAPDRPDWRD